MYLSELSFEFGFLVLPQYNKLIVSTGSLLDGTKRAPTRQYKRPFGCAGKGAFKCIFSS